eukprot:TRINITY_DN928_c0_g3_i1.p1 TRINITY_DN928_c0_g3~~TRINITY_DN928_c0_g3_i1.p1  ORF type:complete len:672 (-),score=222.91 TRINITY_DN928_c0_g3_i1:75-2090(-)
MKSASAAVIGSLYLSASAGAIKVSSESHVSPVTKVVTLLKDLKVKLDKDGKADQADYDKYKKWCGDVQKSKADLIEEQTRTIKTLTTEITEGEAKDEKLEEDIEETVEEEHKNEDASDEGSNDRSNDNHERQDEKAHNTKNLVDLKDAADVLTKAAKPSDTTAGGYTAKSDRIMGMVTDQAETTQEEEETESKVEAKAQANFDGWITDMKAELGLLKKQEKKERTEEAETDEEIAEDTEMKEDTAEQREADAAFLKEAEESCERRDSEFTQRSKLRAQELSGVDKALEILASKADLLENTFTDVPGAPDASFLQISQSNAGSAKKSAYSALKAKVQQTQSHRLAALAAQVQMAPPGAFGSVLKAIDDMMAELKAETATDKKKKDHCKREYQSVATKSSNLGFLIQKNDATIDKIDSRLEELSENYAEAGKEVEQIDAELKAMEDLRNEQHTNFQNDKADDELAISTLQETMKALASYYDEHTGGFESFIQVDPSKMSKKRRELKKKEHQYTLTDEASQKGASSGVLAILQRIVVNLEDEISDGKKTEADNLISYEKESGLLKATKDKLVKKMTSIENMKAKNQEKKSDEEDTKDSNNDQLDGQKSYKASIKEECDWMLAQFEYRVARRTAEMDGLVRAKELLNGASFVQEAKDKKAAKSTAGTLASYLLRK